MTGDPSTLKQLAALVAGQLAPQEVREELWPEIVRLAVQQGLGPMLVWTVKRAAFQTGPGAHWSGLLQSVRQTGLRYILLERTREQVGTALAGAGVPCIWLKGAALAHTVYPQPTLRPMSDLDVLVRSDRVDASLEALEARQYRYFHAEETERLWRRHSALDRKLSHHHELAGGPGNAVVVELHWRFVTYLPPEQMEWFWTQSQPLADDPMIRILAPTAHLLYLCAHAVLQHGEMEIGLRHYFDLHLLASQGTIDWELLLRQAAVFRWTFGVERALTRAVDSFSAPVPEEVFQRLREQRPADEKVALAMMLQTRGARWGEMLHALSLLSLREKIHLVLRVIFPTRAYLRHRYQIGPKRSVWRFYFYRWFDQGREVCWATWNRLKKRFSPPP